MASHLTINPAPYKSSNLAHPPSPFSPRLPNTPPASAPPKRSNSTERPTKLNLKLSPPPADPLHWLWQCHVCNRVYKIGVTRRCLDDGHYFCAGTTTVKRNRKTNRKVVRHRACASEFDYQGWKAWGTWRREVVDQAEAARGLAALADLDVAMPLRVPKAPTEGQWLAGSSTMEAMVVPQALKGSRRKNCWDACDYPSECRWGKQYGVQTPVQPTVTVAASPPALTPKAPKPATTFDDILLDSSVADASSAAAEQSQRASQETTGKAEVLDEQTKKPSMDDLLTSAKRRKRRSAGQMPSPLASHPPSPTAETRQEAFPAAGALSSVGQSTASVSHRPKASDDLELDMRRSLFEHAGGLVTSWASSVRSAPSLEEVKTEMSVKPLRVRKG